MANAGKSIHLGAYHDFGARRPCLGSECGLQSVNGFLDLKTVVPEVGAEQICGGMLLVCHLGGVIHLL